jgi:membrane-associated protease RseP (regulator of RpoE activity)
MGFCSRTENQKLFRSDSSITNQEFEGERGGPIIRNLRGFILLVLLGVLTLCVGLSFREFCGSAANGHSTAYGAAFPETRISVVSGLCYTDPWLGASGVDMTLKIGQAMNTEISYGWLIIEVYPGGPADKAGLEGGTTQTQINGTSLLIGGDIMIAINGTRITGFNDLSAYMEENTVPGQSIIVTIIRHNEILTLPLTLGSTPVLAVYVLTVLVVNSENNTPISDVNVWIQGIETLEDTTDTNGRLTFQNIPAGGYTISISKNGYETGSAKLEIDNDTNATLSLQPIEEQPSMTISKPIILTLVLFFSAFVSSAVLLMVLAAEHTRKRKRSQR